MQEAGHFNSVRQGYNTDVILSAPKLALRKITFNSADGTQLVTNQTWRFNLSSPLYNVVFVDWGLINNINNGNTGGNGACLMRIDEIPSYGITSSGQGYFAALVGGTTQNLLMNPQPPVKYNPLSISQLTFTLFAGANSFSQTQAWSIELYFYIEDS
jgi:hypothetical protein